MDAVVTTDYFAVPAYRRLGIPCVLCFSSFPKDIYRPIETTRDIAVSFVGNCGRSDRRAFILSLRSQGVDVRAYGQGSKNGFVPRPELSRIFSRSKINLNFTKMDFFGWHNMDDAVLTNRVRQNKGRPIEVALSRSFCLSEYAPALPHVFEIGREIDCFCDIPSLGDKVRYYLAHDEEREEMAQRSYQRALREYEDDPYMLKVLQELDAALNQPPPYCVDAPSAHKGPRFEERHVHQLSVQFFWWLSRGRIRLAWEVLPDLLQYGLKMFLIGFCKGMARSLGIVCAHRLWPRRPPDPL
ncbi:MAG: glycosyltransferase [Elusimicrobia bacterium]|nr:glycosyltransferase [Elusimicrobiota bacterium]